MGKAPARRVTVIDVARAAGVSAGTVSNALGNLRHVDPATKARVIAAAEALSYSPSVRAQRLRGRRCDTIGLFLSFPLSSSSGHSRIGFAMEVAAVAAAEAAERGVALMLVPPVDATAMSRFLDVDGAIFIEPTSNNAIARRLRANGIPIVSIGADPAEPDQPYVDTRTFQGTMVLLEHLRSRGCREIAFVGSNEDHDLQRESWRAFTAFVGAQVKSRSSLRLPEIDGIAKTRHAVERLLAENPSIDAIIAPYDPFAIGAYEAVLAGEDARKPVKVATRYGSARVRELGITSLSLDLPAISSAAVRLLFSLMEGHGVVTRAVVPPADLAIRSSS